MKVLIVDDSRIIRERLAGMLAAIEGVEIVGEADSPDSAVAAITTLKPDVVLLDLILSDGSGIHVLRRVRGSLPALKVVVLTNYPYPRYHDLCLELGADHFFDKSNEFDKAIDMVKQWKIDFERQAPRPGDEEG